MLGLAEHLLAIHADCKEALDFYIEGNYALMRANLEHLRDAAAKALKIKTPEKREPTESSEASSMWGDQN